MADQPSSMPSSAPTVLTTPNMPGFSMSPSVSAMPTSLAVPTMPPAQGMPVDSPVYSPSYVSPTFLGSPTINFPTPPPQSFPTAAPIAPTHPPHLLPDLEEDSEAARKFGLVVLAFVLLCILYCCMRRWFYNCRMRRERRMLELQSQRADSVLGDMQMVPNDDYDEDGNELI